jgi:uncharacterized protein with GYD domain
MPKYLIQASYTAEGVRGVVSEGGSSRRDAVAKVAEGLGGTLESFYFAFGEDDVVTVIDLPDAESAAAVSMAVAASGLVTIKTTVLITTEQMDTAAHKSVSYRAPGR